MKSPLQQQSNLGPPDPDKLRDMWRIILDVYLEQWMKEQGLNGNGTGKGSKS